MPGDPPSESRFLTDRMLGALTRYLRFMGYDTTSATSLAVGNVREDTLLLEMAEQEGRILLTRDAELAQRGRDRAVYLRPVDVMDQVRQLVESGLVRRQLPLSRCSMCNTVLREATTCEIGQAEYAPKDWRGLRFTWCGQCRKVYWNGSHSRQLEERILEGEGAGE